MARVEIDGDRLVVVVEGAHRLWALKSRLEIPLENMQGATVDSGIARERKGFRAPGTHIPGVLTAGTFYQNGERIFWDIKDGDQAVVIQLRNEQYARLVIEVDDARAAVTRIDRALHRDA
jgi:hypothetical protein